MMLNILKAKSQEGKKEKFSLVLDLKSDLLEDRFIVLDKANIDGEFYYENEQLFLKANVQVPIRCVCDSCGEEYEKVLKFKIDEKFVEAYNSHDDEDYEIASGTQIDLDAVLLDNLLLSLPSRNLCREDCKGLCSVCGKNKNYQTCNCEEIQMEQEREEQNPFSKLKNRS